MNAGDDCKQVLLTQADFDGELDAAKAAEQEAHRETCAQCRAVYENLTLVRNALRTDDLYQRAPDSLRAALPRPSPAKPAAKPITHSSWWPISNFGMGAALAAGIALLIAWSDTSDLTDRIVDDHIRALQPGHLWDVESTDRHTVKPWFDGRIDFAPPVKDLADKEFPLKGGRLDYVDGRPVAGLVYEHGHHPIDLLVWPASGTTAEAPIVAMRNGYTIVHWTEGGMVLWAVSDLERGQLVDFVRLWREAN